MSLIPLVVLFTTLLAPSTIYNFGAEISSSSVQTIYRYDEHTQIKTFYVNRRLSRVEIEFDAPRRFSHPETYLSFAFNIVGYPKDFFWQTIQDDEIYYAFKPYHIKVLFIGAAVTRMVVFMKN